MDLKKILNQICNIFLQSHKNWKNLDFVVFCSKIGFFTFPNALRETIKEQITYFSLSSLWRIWRLEDDSDILNLSHFKQPFD